MFDVSPMLVLDGTKDCYVNMLSHIHTYIHTCTYIHIRKHTYIRGPCPCRYIIRWFRWWWWWWFL